jgi:hypothetical protein
MKKDKIISLAREQGAHVVVNNIDKDEVISVFLGKADMGNSNIEGWKHGIFIKEINAYWEIAYSQNSKTRLLMDTEVIKVVEQWCTNPSNELLDGYK